MLWAEDLIAKEWWNRLRTCLTSMADKTVGAWYNLSIDRPRTSLLMDADDFGLSMILSKSDVEVKRSKVCKKDVLLQARFVGEQQKMPTGLIVPGSDNKSSVELGNSQLPLDFGDAPACRSPEESWSSSTKDSASLVAVDKLLMDHIPAKVLLFPTSTCEALMYIRPITNTDHLGALGGSSWHEEAIGSPALGTTPSTLEVFSEMEQLSLPVQIQQSRLGPLYYVVTDYHHGGDPSSCTSLRKLRRNIVEIRK
ncbi:hypothetical protein Nepgr_029568 [Nepenthes gracilis]|uniref:Uncharacterized protein n=1 Tax=Nepenthes gracilis TaxID=150966 RepID=A0AAD3TCQ8_NEPGR|nr:hypothetical protein Nepgr_029568 [Nepenthes gracilis]